MDRVFPKKQNNKENEPKKKTKKKQNRETAKKKQKTAGIFDELKSWFWNSNRELWTPGAWNPDFEIQIGGIETWGPR